MHTLEKVTNLVARLSNLNPSHAGIGAGMLAQIVAEATEIHADLLQGSLPVYTVLSRRDLTRMLKAHDDRHAQDAPVGPSEITTSSWHSVVALPLASRPIEGRLQLHSGLRLA